MEILFPLTPSVGRRRRRRRRGWVGFNNFLQSISWIHQTWNQQFGSPLIAIWDTFKNTWEIAETQSSMPTADSALKKPASSFKCLMLAETSRKIAIFLQEKNRKRAWYPAYVCNVRKRNRFSMPKYCRTRFDFPESRQAKKKSRNEIAPRVRNWSLRVTRKKKATPAPQFPEFPTCAVFPHPFSLLLGNYLNMHVLEKHAMPVRHQKRPPRPIEPSRFPHLFCLHTYEAGQNRVSALTPCVCIITLVRKAGLLCSQDK